MKKVNLFAVAGIVIATIVAVVLLVSFSGKKEKETTLDIFECSNVSEIKEYAEKNKVQYYGNDDDSLTISNSNVLGYDTEVVFFLIDEEVYKSEAYIPLFEYVSEEAQDDYNYKFSEEDKKDIEESISEVLSRLGNEFGCTIEQYDIVKNGKDVTYDNEEEAFFDGLITREYSIRDKEGRLWLLRIAAYQNYSNAILIQVADESNYEGFIPSVDLSSEE